MSGSLFSSVAVNPFVNPVVAEPREVNYSVPELNDFALEALCAPFADLENGQVPRRPVRASLAYLVVSPDRGYGKSHLIGRLFQRLRHRASKIYIRPFQDPHKCWQSILLTMVQELQRAEEGQPSDDGSQLEYFAVGVLRVLAQLAAAAGTLPVPPRPDHATPTDETTTRYFSAIASDPERFRRLRVELDKGRLELSRSSRSWLRALLTYFVNEAYSDERELVIRWLRAEPLEADEAAHIGIHAGDNENQPDASVFQINQVSYLRLLDLCKLGSYYRPFLFCFDQTEFYASDEPLTRALGGCVERLFAEVPNQLTIVTANQGNWEKDISPHIEPPQLDRFTPPLTLEGIRIDQSRELIRQRLALVGLEAHLNSFTAGAWLEALFERGLIGVRRLLVRAAERFDELRQLATAPVTIEDGFGLKLNEVRLTPELQQYNQDFLIWFIEKLFAGQVPIEKAPANRYFSSVWRLPQRTIYFAFESGDNGRRWSAIAKEAVALAGLEPGAIGVVFRTPDQTELPRPGWLQIGPEIEAAEKDGLVICRLTPEETVEIHSAREFYSDALQGNFGAEPEQIRLWLQNRLESWLARLGGPVAGATPAPAPAPPALVEPAQLTAALDYVAKHRFVDIRSVLGAIPGLTSEALLPALEGTAVKAHPGPQTIVLQWMEPLSR
jgi:hypothetical protein